MTAAVAKRARKYVYMVVNRTVRIETGEAVGALIPLTKWDARALRDRKYNVGTVLRVELKKRRNVKFHRLAHALGGLVVDQIPDFVGLTAHDALKRLQLECGAECDVVQQDARPVLKVVLAVVEAVLGAKAAQLLTRSMPPIQQLPVKVARSISFDELDEGGFQELVGAIYKHLAATYWTEMTPEAVEEMVLLYEGES